MIQATSSWMVGALTDLFDGCHSARVLSSNACAGCAVRRNRATP